MWKRINIKELQVSANSIYLHCPDQKAARHISDQLISAADDIIWLRYQLKKLKKGIIQLGEFAELENSNKNSLTIA